jgi:hypothetical protein
VIQLPFTFILFGQEWRVRAAKQHELTDLGICKPDDFEIVIDINQTAETKIHTLTHEVIHAMEQKLQLEMTERQVDLMALGLIDLLRNNPGFLDYIDLEEEQ